MSMHFDRKVDEFIWENVKSENMEQWIERENIHGQKGIAMSEKVKKEIWFRQPG